MTLNLINKRGLATFEFAVMQDLSEKFHDRLKTNYYNNSKNVEPKLFVEVKKHASKPSQEMTCKYSVHTRLEAPSVIAASHESDWNLKKALNKAFDNLSNELSKKFKDTSARIKKIKKAQF